VDAIRALAMHKHNARLGTTRAVANPGNDTGSHGVSDPSGQARGHIGRAQRGRLTPWFPVPQRQWHLQWAAKSAAQSPSVRASPAQSSTLALVTTFRGSTGAQVGYGRAGGHACRPGTTSIFEVGPEVVLSNTPSGDVNQGREMEVLA
jgi:hypothetical protein